MPRTLLALLLVGLVACGTTAAHDRLVTVDTLPGGILLTSTAFPVDSGQWTLVHERDVQPAAEQPGELVNPWDVALADDGTLYVVDQDPAVVQVYGPDGVFRRSIGREGSGPGEFRGGYITVRGDQLLLQDPRGARATVWDLGTDSVLSIRPTGCCVGDKIFDDGAGRAVIRLLTQDDSTVGPRQGFVRIPIAGGPGDTVYVMQDPAAADEVRWNIGEAGRMLFSAPVPMASRPYETVDPTGGFVTGWSGEYLIRRSSDGRDTTALFRRSPTPVVVSDREKRAFVEVTVARMLANGMGVSEAALRRALDPALIPDTRPAFERLYVDRMGRTWVRLSVPDTANVHLDLFDPQGRWLDQVTVAHRQWAETSFTPLAFSRDHVAILGEDDDGLPVVSIYRIERRPH